MKTYNGKMYIQTSNIGGFPQAIQAMRNSFDSWDKSDSGYIDGTWIFGNNDMKLAKKLIEAGDSHAKFMRHIQVWADLRMPRYFYQEFDTYKFGTRISSSTVHKLLNGGIITANDFLYDEADEFYMKVTIERLNMIRDLYKTSVEPAEKKELLARAKRILPEGYLQFSSYNTNYQTLRNMYKQRENHALKAEWQVVFGSWINSLPYSKQLIMRP